MRTRSIQDSGYDPSRYFDRNRVGRNPFLFVTDELSDGHLERSTSPDSDFETITENFMPEENASADSTALADTTIDTPAPVDNSSDQGGDAGDPFAELDAFFDSDQAETDDDAGQDTDSEPDSDQAATPEPDEGQTEDDTQTEGEDPAAKPASGDQPQPEADFEALDKKVDFLDEAGLKARFPRNSSKELIQQAAQYSEIAKKGQEVIEKIGGDHFVEPTVKIASGIREDNPQQLFEGVVEASGAEGLISMVGAVMDLALMRADHFKGQEGSEQFGLALSALADKAIETRFGQGLTTEKVEKLAELAEIGWLEKIEKWQKDEWVDREELDQLMAAANDPKLRAALQEKDQLKSALAQKTQEAQAAATAAEAEIEREFGSDIAEKVSKTLTEIVWARSPLRDLESDSAEAKAEKALLRKTLEIQAIEAFQADPKLPEYKQAYKHGLAETAKFRSALATAINSAVLATRENTAIAERLVAKIHGKGRNQQLLAQQQQRQNAATRLNSEQVATSQPAQPNRGDTITEDDVWAQMDQAVAAIAP